MKKKSVLTIALLGFVAVSVVAMVWKETRPSPVAQRLVEADATGAKLIAYYFHGKVRCVTCNEIESSAREAIETGFRPELDAGRIEWRVINYEEPGNEQYATDYQLAAPCVVLASMRDGRQESWTSLPEVWELVGDQPAFRRFIHERVAQQLAGVPTQKTEAVSVVEAVPLLKPNVEGLALPSVASRPRLVDLGAGQCIPCKKMAPILEELREAYKGRFDVVVLDISEDSSVAERYAVSTIPTQIFYDAEGKERFRHEGFFSREEILSKWSELGVDVTPGAQQ